MAWEKEFWRKMPIYTYECGSCGKTDDYLVSGMDIVLSSCSGCGSGDLEKKVSAPNIGGSSKNEGVWPGKIRRIEQDIPNGKIVSSTYYLDDKPVVKIEGGILRRE